MQTPLLESLVVVLNMQMPLASTREEGPRPALRIVHANLKAVSIWVTFLHQTKSTATMRFVCRNQWHIHSTYNVGPRKQQNMQPPLLESLLVVLNLQMPSTRPALRIVHANSKAVRIWVAFLHQSKRTSPMRFVWILKPMSHNLQCRT
jgi:hypothetical protein